jgi:hypothetical protein
MIRIYVVSTLSVFLSSCQLFSPPDANLFVPFDASAAGSVFESRIRVRAERGYGFFIVLGFREGDRADEERVKRLAGLGQVKIGESRLPLIPIPLRLKVVRIDGGKNSLVIDTKINTNTTESFSEEYIWEQIAGFPLAPGNYQIRLESLENIPALSGTPIFFDIHVRHMK